MSFVTVKVPRLLNRVVAWEQGQHGSGILTILILRWLVPEQVQMPASVSPTVTTTYYLRVEGTASPCTANLAGPAAGVTVTVRQPSIAPATLNASVNPICRGNSSTTLTQTGGSLGKPAPAGNGTVMQLTLYL